MSLRIAHLSDIHFGGENQAAVAAALALLLDEPPELVIVSGDLTTQGRRLEFAAAQAFLEPLIAPLLITPGNHDTPYTVERLYSPFARYEQAIGPANTDLAVGADMVAVAVNTARGMQVRPNWSKGAISERQTDEALTALSDAPRGALRIVVCHHPLVEMIAGPMTGRVRGGETAARRFAESEVDLILTGHVHVPFALALPYADQHTYAAGAGTLSLRERGAPAGFNLIEVDAAGILVKALAWTGSHFEPWRTWSLDRRTT